MKTLIQRLSEIQNINIEYFLKKNNVPNYKEMDFKELYNRLNCAIFDKPSETDREPKCIQSTKIIEPNYYINMTKEKQFALSPERLSKKITNNNGNNKLSAYDKVKFDLLKDKERNLRFKISDINNNKENTLFRTENEICS